ncbi:hypothetical protein [Polynucleobacter yangtzensis]|uniref:DNA polymerase family A n=1 Tax=Polynucleobacter yangtzensis TaxID=1743159 RepID=A0ABM8CMA0_9BURK|nr:hypothetical protein [Polynucleobacter yangtzensis]BDT78938.1 hypothetical protein PKF032_08260 [Polynucleobacter yangtzensis]
MTKRDRFFNPLRKAKSASAKALVAEVINELHNYESHFELRKRSRKKRDLEIFNRQIEAIICEAVHRYLTGADKRIAISLSNRHLGRRDSESKILNNTLSQNIKNLASPEMGFIELQTGNQMTGEVTSFWAGKRLKTRINDRKLTHLDLTLEKGKNVIELREEKAHGQAKGKLIKYPETALTIQYRDEMEQINAFLRDADICYQGNKDIDDSRVELKRIFNNGSFEQGGRLYGGFWIALKSADLRDITIGNEWVTALDYGQMAIRLAYSLAKAPIHFEDAYALDRKTDSARAAIKKLMNIMLNAPTTKTWSASKSMGARHKDSDFQRKLMKEIEEFHKPIAHLFGTANGMKFMFIESEILIDVLLELNSKGIVALPIHDCILVKESAQNTAKEVMLKVFKQHTNLDATVAVGAL